MYIYENRIEQTNKSKRERLIGKGKRERLCLRMYNNYIKKSIYINNINNINLCVRCVVQNEESREENEEPAKSVIEQTKALERIKQERTKTREKREDLKKKKRKGYGGGERECFR